MDMLHSARALLRVIASRGSAVGMVIPTPRSPGAAFIASASFGLGVLLHPEASARLARAPFARAHCEGGAAPSKRALVPHTRMACTPSAPPEDGGAPKPTKDDIKDGDDGTEEVVDLIIASFAKVVTKMGFGGICGFCVGYATKQVTKAIALWVGLLFMLLQGLAFQGYIEIKWQKIKSSLTGLVDMDGDGEFSTKDMKSLLMGSFKVLKHNLPQASSFGPGFYYGLKC